MSVPIDAVETTSNGTTENGKPSFLYQIMSAISGNIEALTNYQVAQAETVSMLSDHSTLVTQRHNSDLDWWYDAHVSPNLGSDDGATIAKAQSAQAVYGSIDSEWAGLETVASGMISRAQSGLDMLSSAIANSTSFTDSLVGIMSNLKNQKVSA